MMPYVFPRTAGRRILYIDLHSNLARMVDCMRVHREPTNVQRILHGMVDGYAFLVKEQPVTEFCRYHLHSRPPWLWLLKQTGEQLFFVLLCWGVSLMRVVTGHRSRHWLQRRIKRVWRWVCHHLLT